MTRARDVANLIGSGNFSSTTFTATAGQTAFTISHTQGFIQVFMNGLLLDETVDYTSNGSAVTLTSGAAAGDEIEVVAYNTFSVGDALNQAAADTRYVNATGDTMSGNLTTTGNVGVGETSPNLGSSGTGLHIKGAASKDGVIKLDSQTANRSGIVQFTENGTDKWRIGYDATNNHLEFTRSGVADRMLISDDGHVTKPNQPSFMAYQNPTRDTSGTYNEILRNFGTVRHNIGNHYNNSTGRFTAPVAGRYLFNAVITYDQSVSFSYLLYFQINGNASFVGANQNYGTTSMSVVYNLNANDYVDLHSDRAHFASSPRNHWSGYLLG